MKLRKKLTKSATHQHQTQKEAQQNDTKKKGHKTKSCTSVQTSQTTSTSVPPPTEHPAITEQTPEHDASTSVQVASTATLSRSIPLPKVGVCSAVQCSRLDLPYLVGTTRDGGCLKCCVSALVNDVATHMHYPTAYGLDFCTCFCHAEPRGPHKADFEKLGAFVFGVGDGRLKISGICDGEEAFRGRSGQLSGSQGRLGGLPCEGQRALEWARPHIDWWDEYSCASLKNAKLKAAHQGCITCARWHDEDAPADMACPCECHEPFPWDEKEDSSPLVQAQSTSSFPPPSLEGGGNDEKDFDVAALHESASLLKGRLSDKIPDASGISPRLSTPRERAQTAAANVVFSYEPLPLAAFIRPGERPLLPKGAARLEREAIAREGLGQEQARLFGSEVEGFAAPELGFSSTRALVRAIEAASCDRCGHTQASHYAGECIAMASDRPTCGCPAFVEKAAKYHVFQVESIRTHKVRPVEQTLPVSALSKQEPGTCRCGHTWESHQRRAPYATVCGYDYGGGNTCGCDEWRPQ